jgi:hypothetical protein
MTNAVMASVATWEQYKEGPGAEECLRLVQSGCVFRLVVGRIGEREGKEVLNLK